MKIAFDNNVINKLISSDNKYTDIANELLLLKNNKKIEPYALPVNIIEIALCKDLTKRNAMAKILNELIDGIRIAYTVEQQTAWDFSRLINLHWPNSSSAPSDVAKLGINNLIFLGLLGQMAAIENYQIGLFSEQIKNKLVSSYLRSNILANPDEYLISFEDQVNGKKPIETLLQLNNEVEKLTFSELQDKISQNLTNAKSFSKINRFSNIKSKLIELYSYSTLLDLLSKHFHYFEDMLEHINIKEIISNWDKKLPMASECDQPRLNLHKDLIEFQKNPINPAKYHYLLLFDELAYRYRLGLIPLSYIMMSTYFDEIERSLKNPSTFNQGSSFDIEYLTSILHGDIFFTYDGKLQSSIKQIRKNLFTNKDKKAAVVIDSISKLRRLLN